MPNYLGEQHENIDYRLYEKYKTAYQRLQEFQELWVRYNRIFGLEKPLEDVVKEMRQTIIDVENARKLEEEGKLPDFQGGGNTPDNAAGSGPESIPLTDQSGNPNPAPDPLTESGGSDTASTNNPTQ